MSTISLVRGCPVGFSVVPSRVPTPAPWRKGSTVGRNVPELKASSTRYSFDPTDPFLQGYRSMLAAVEPPEEWNEAVRDLSPFTSKYGYTYLILILEVSWLLKLAEVFSVDDQLRVSLRILLEKFSMNDAVAILEMYSGAPNEVVAVREFLQRQFRHYKLPQVFKFLASPSLDNDMLALARSVMVRRSLDHVIIPQMLKPPQACLAHGKFSNGMLRAAAFKEDLMVAAKGLSTQLEYTQKLPLIHQYFTDLHYLANCSPDVNWEDVSRDFVTSFGIEYCPVAKQIKPRGNLPRVASCTSGYNQVLCTFNQDILKKHSERFGHEAYTNFSLGAWNLSSANVLLDTCATEEEQEDHILMDYLMKGFCMSLLGYNDFLRGLATLHK